MVISLKWVDCMWNLASVIVIENVYILLDGSIALLDGSIALLIDGCHSWFCEDAADFMKMEWSVVDSIIWYCCWGHWQHIGGN